MQPYTVFVVEKTTSLKAIAPLLSSQWGGTHFAVTLNYLGHYEFRYPRGLGMSALPLTREPKWKLRPSITGHATVFLLDDTGVQPSDRALPDLLAGAASIVFAADPDRSGVSGFHVLLQQCLGNDQALAERPAVKLYALDKASIGTAINNVGTTRDRWFVELRNAGIRRCGLSVPRRKQLFHNCRRMFYRS